MLRKLLGMTRKEPDPQFKFRNLKSNVLLVRNFSFLKKAMGWKNDPILEGDHLNQFQYLEDLNDRRLRDAEVICSACCNGNHNIILEIGTSYGNTTAMIAKNAPSAKIYTVNIPPGEIDEGGNNVTFALSKEDIGRVYRDLGATNVKQIFANTLNWEPDFYPIDVAFIDGCHTLLVSQADLT